MAITLLLLGLCVPLWLALKLERSVFGPASGANLVWLGMALGGAFTARSSTYWVGLLAVLWFVLVFTVCALGVQQFVAARPGLATHQSTDSVRFSRLWAVFWVLLLVATSVAAVVLPLIHVGVEELVLQAMLDASAQLTDDRYGGEGLPGYMNALLCGVYGLCLMCGWMWAMNAKPMRWLLWLTLLGPVSAMAYGVITTARATIVFGALYVFGAFAASRMFHQAHVPQQRSRTVLQSLLLAGLVLVAFIGLFVAAGSLRASDEDFGQILHKLDAYVAGIEGLGFWMLQDRLFEPMWGLRTFAGPASLLGLGTRELGIVQDYFLLSSGRISNLYTGLRWVIEDFTPIGATLALALLGGVAGGLWQLTCEGRLMPAAVYAVVSTLWLGSPISALFAYNSLILASGLFLLGIIPLMYSTTFVSPSIGPQTQGSS